MSFMSFIEEHAPQWPFGAAVEQEGQYSLFIVCAGGSMTFALDYCACTEAEAKVAFNDMLLLDDERMKAGMPEDGTFSMFLSSARHVPAGSILPEGARLLRGFTLHGNSKEMFMALAATAK